MFPFRNYFRFPLPSFMCLLPPLNNLIGLYNILVTHITIHPIIHLQTTPKQLTNHICIIFHPFNLLLLPLNEIPHSYHTNKNK